jgi:UDPglucose 6-dehydrogenase
MRKPVIFDGRNLYRLADMQKQGFTYYSVGRAAVKAG